MIREAEMINQVLASSNPEVFNPVFVISLNNLSLFLNDTGKRVVLQKFRLVRFRALFTRTGKPNGLGMLALASNRKLNRELGSVRFKRQFERVRTWFRSYQCGESA